MHSGSNKDINLCSNFVAIFLITVFIAHQETKDSYDFVIVMDGRSIVSPPGDSLGAQSGSTCSLASDFSFQFSDVMPTMED